MHSFYVRSFSYIWQFLFIYFLQQTLNCKWSVDNSLQSAKRNVMFSLRFWRAVFLTGVGLLGLYASLTYNVRYDEPSTEPPLPLSSTSSSSSSPSTPTAETSTLEVVTVVSTTENVTAEWSLSAKE